MLSALGLVVVTAMTSTPAVRMMGIPSDASLESDARHESQWSIADSSARLFPPARPLLPSISHITVAPSSGWPMRMR